MKVSVALQSFNYALHLNYVWSRGHAGILVEGSSSVHWHFLPRIRHHCSAPGSLQFNGAIPRHFAHPFSQRGAVSHPAQQPLLPPQSSTFPLLVEQTFPLDPAVLLFSLSIL